MKKKWFLTVVSLLLVVLCLVGCSDYSEQITKIDRLLNASYTKVHLSVSVSQNLDELESWFEVVYNDDGSSTVTFKIKRFSTFDGDQLPEDYIETFQGSATVKDGTVTNVTGDVPQDVQLQNVLGSMQFSPNYLSDIEVNGNVLKANVSKPQAFMGQTDFHCKDNTMIVTVSYDNVLNYVRIQYTSTNGAQVVMMYTYTA